MLSIVGGDGSHSWSLARANAMERDEPAGLKQAAERDVSSIGCLPNFVTVPSPNF